ncbi:hypothetical protein HDU89_001705 [Geranomyces variabilis]|nr:hypothetical protein HDU89_001705 [Geranomyces variabilis]
MANAHFAQPPPPKSPLRQDKNLFDSFTDPWALDDNLATTSSYKGTLALPPTPDYHQAIWSQTHYDGQPPPVAAPAASTHEGGSSDDNNFNIWWDSDMSALPPRPDSALRQRGGSSQTPPHSRPSTPRARSFPAAPTAGSPARKRSADLDRANAMAAIAPAGGDCIGLPYSEVPAGAPNAGTHVPLRKLSFGCSTPAPGGMHVVAKTDTLAGIAVLHRVTIAELRAANRLWSDSDFLLRSHLVIPKRDDKHGSSAGLYSLAEDPHVAPSAENPTTDATAAFRLSPVAESVPLMPIARCSTTSDFLTSLDMEIAGALKALGQSPLPADVPRIGHLPSHPGAPALRRTLGTWDAVMPYTTSALKHGDNRGSPATWISRIFENLRQDATSRPPERSSHHYSRVNTSES